MIEPGCFRWLFLTAKRAVPHLRGMTTREIKARERKIQQLAAAETNIFERLLELRDDVDLLGRTIDRWTLVKPRMHAGGGRSGLSNLVPFRRGGRFMA